MKHFFPGCFLLNINKSNIIFYLKFAGLQKIYREKFLNAYKANKFI